VSDLIESIVQLAIRVPWRGMMRKMSRLLVLRREKIRKCLLGISLFAFSSFSFFFVLYRLSFLPLSRLEDAAHEGPLQPAGFQGSLLEWALEKTKKEKKKKEEEKTR
jgi:hypothetical protein